MPAFSHRKSDLTRDVRCSHLLAFLRQACSDCERIDLVFLPPQSLVADCVILLMVNGTEWYRKFVADLEPKPPGLGEADVDGRG